MQAAEYNTVGSGSRGGTEGQARGLVQSSPQVTQVGMRDGSGQTELGHSWRGR